MENTFKYPFSFRWIVLSLILVILSVILVLAALGTHIILFLVLMLPQTVLFTIIKYKLYKKIDVVNSNPLLFFSLDGEGGSLCAVMLVSIVLFGFAFPFILLFLLEPVMWFVSVLSFVAGINLPELFLYFYKSKKLVS